MRVSPLLIYSSALLDWLTCSHLTVSIWNVNKQFKNSKFLQDGDFDINGIFQLLHIYEKLVQNNIVIILCSVAIYKNTTTDENMLSLSLYDVVLIACMKAKAAY